MKIEKIILDDYQVSVSKFELEVLFKALSLYGHDVKGISWTDNEYYILLRIITELKIVLTPEA